MSIRKGIKIFSLCLSLCLVLYPVSVVIADEEEPQEVTEQVEQSVEEAVVEEEVAPSDEAVPDENESAADDAEATVEPESEPEETEASEDGEMNVSSDDEDEVPEEEPEVSVISNAAIQIDGSASDWDNIHMLSASDANCIGWAVAKDKSNYYFCMWGNSVPLWFDVVYDDGTQWNANAIQLTWDSSAVKGGWYQDIPGSEAATGNGVTEFSVPADFFSNQNFTITYSGTSVTSADIPSASGSLPSIGGVSGGDTDEDIDTEIPDEDEEEEEETPVYNGIVIDSDFSDWAAVAKVNPESEAVDSAAMVFDGDYVYIYLSSSINYAVAGAGSHGNGKYEILTDLGGRLIFQVNNKANNRYCVDDSLVSGVDGVKAAYSDQIWGLDKYEYEIAIPASALPNYNKTISFGLYLGETFVFDVADMQGSEGGEFGGIVYDGQYNDWKFYPHTEIEYATPGTHEEVVDGEGALYSENGLLYGHVVTRMAPHLQEGGGEFAYAVTIRANDEYDFYPCLIAIDSAGNINWSPQLTGLDYGTYEFYIVDAQSWHTAKTLSELQSGDGPDKLFGQMYMTIGPSSDEMEFKVYIDKLAEKFGLDANDIKLLSAQFGRIGQQWIHTAGTSSAPWTGLGVCFAAVGGTMFCRRRKNRGTAV